MSENILEINSLSKYFGGLAAVSDCSLNVKKGTITGIIGPKSRQKIINRDPNQYQREIYDYTKYLFADLQSQHFIQ